MTDYTLDPFHYENDDDDYRTAYAPLTRAEQSQVDRECDEMMDEFLRQCAEGER